MLVGDVVEGGKGGLVAATVVDLEIPYVSQLLVRTLSFFYP